MFTLVNSYYYRGGDTEMYFNCAEYLKRAVSDDSQNFTKIYMTKVINVKTTLMNYFIYADTKYPVFEAMHEPGNFLVPKIALPVIMLFGNSYLCAAMFFSFFALGGQIRLFKFFYHYFPNYWREIALATMFLPSIAYWSAGVMKDPITFGAIGYIVYALLNIFIKKTNYLLSIFWIVLCCMLLFYIKIYILLALSPAVVLWLFTEINKTVENKTLRRIMGFFTFTIGSVLGLILINYVTSDESLKSFRLDAIVETSANNRELYTGFSEHLEGSYYNIGTTNPVLLILNGLVAALFRPFLWEVNGPTALLSALEALFFFYITGLLMYKRGFLNFFRKAFSHPILLMCFVFSVIFAAAVGSSALNFGSLSRYKIPSLPFYLFMVLVLYNQAGLQYPEWFKKILGYKPPPMKKAKLTFG